MFCEEELRFSGDEPRSLGTNYIPGAFGLLDSLRALCRVEAIRGIQVFLGDQQNNRLGARVVIVNQPARALFLMRSREEAVPVGLITRRPLVRIQPPLSYRN